MRILSLLLSIIAVSTQSPDACRTGGGIAPACKTTSPTSYPQQSSIPARTYSATITRTVRDSLYPTVSSTGSAAGSESGTVSGTGSSTPSSSTGPSASDTMQTSKSPSLILQSYSLTFPNSNPIAAVIPANLAYLITAIACSAKVPAGLVYISQIHANGAAVNFVQPPHTVAGVPKNCTAISVRNRQLPAVVVATPNMLVVVNYVSPAPANQTDAVFQSFTESIRGSAAPAAPPTPASNSDGVISTRSISGIVMGIIAAIAVAVGLYAMYTSRDQHPKRPISQSTVVVQGPHWANRNS